MTKKKLEKFRKRIAILIMLTYLATVLGCTLCFAYAIFYQNISFIFYGILLLVSYFLCSAVLESLHFLLEERIYGVKNLEEDNDKPNTENETIKSDSDN